MLLFTHNDSDLTFGCSYKVMFSFFTSHLDKFRQSGELYSSDSEAKVNYFFVRDPYERVKSLFADKLRASVDRGHIQLCQQVMIEHFGFSNVEELKTISFDSFCAELPYFYKSDAHFYPQECGYNSRNIEQVIKMESNFSHLNELGLSGVDFQSKNHSSPSDIKGTLHYSPDSKLIIRTLYAYDFKLFEYAA